jgi:alpha-ribazole phosphatase/probable phosphoglycerate mutase
MTGAPVIFVRHAEPQDEMRGRVYGRIDVELSARGRRHAEEIAATLVTEPIVAVYSSPLRRAVATARPLARALGLEPIVVADLREIDFGELEGLTVDEAAERYPAEAQWMNAPAGASFPGGESVASLGERAVRAAREIAVRHEGETVAVFSHAVVIRAIVADALAMPLDAMFRLDQSYGGVTIIEWFDGQPFVRMVNAT